MIKYILFPIFRFIWLIIFLIMVYLVVYPFYILFNFLYNFKISCKEVSEMQFTEEYRTVFDWYLRRNKIEKYYPKNNE